MSKKIQYILVAMEDIVYRKILVTYDGSLLAAEAFPHAISLAKTYKAYVLLLWAVHSIELLSAELGAANVYPSVVPYRDVIKIVKENKRIAKMQLESIKSDFEKDGVANVTTYVDEGEAANVIIDVAKMEKCDLIVMSTHGRSGLRRVLLGSVADYVIRHTSCPVLVIHPKEVKNNDK